MLGFDIQSKNPTCNNPALTRIDIYCCFEFPIAFCMQQIISIVIIIFIFIRKVIQGWITICTYIAPEEEY